MNQKLLLLSTPILFSLLVGCGSDSNSTSTGSTTAASITIGHDGVDFSEAGSGGLCDGTSTIAWEMQDGYSISWSPTNNYITGEDSNTGYIWYNNNVNSSSQYLVEDMGEVSLDRITEVPGNWPLITEAIPSLQVGHTYIAQTHDGYVKFNVSSIDANNSCTPVKVTYHSSATTDLSS